MNAVQYVSVRSPSKREDVTEQVDRKGIESPGSIPTGSQSGRLTQGLDWLKINTAQAYEVERNGGNNEGLIVLREQGLHKRLGCLRWGYAPGCMTATILTIA